MKNLHEYLLLIFVVGIVAYIGNWVGDGQLSWTSLAGMVILILIAGLGQMLSKLIPINIPSVIYVIAIGIEASLPQTPWGPSVIAFTNEINLLAIATPILAYAGIAIGRSWTDFVLMGWRAMVVSTCVLFGTLVGSALIAQVVLTLQGII